tara:strand:- start:179 stop:478 length:300 start_codon:yes stop_codon:yes gene_type:complete
MSDVPAITVGHLKEIWKQQNVSDDDPIAFYCTDHKIKISTEIEFEGVYKKHNKGEGILMEFEPSIIEEEEEEEEEYGDDYEPSDQDMMAAFGTKWHDGL